MSFTLNDTVTIAEGVQMPRLGFGVYQSPNDVCTKSTSTALEAGYRHIDSAGYYDNEAQVGEAVTSSSIPRSSVFLTTKILFPAEGNDEEKTYQDLVHGVEKFGLKEDGGKVDLFLIHTPSSGPQGRQTLWKGLERLRKDGKTRAIGVSNYGIKHLEQIKEFSSVPPAVNQIELHPWCQRRDLVAYCQKNNITLQAYCPLVRATKNSDPTLVSIAEAHSVSPSQVLLRWSLQKGFVPLPKSDTPSRIKDNADLYGFELTKDEMTKIDALGEGSDEPVVPTDLNCA